MPEIYVDDEVFAELGSDEKHDELISVLSEIALNKPDFTPLEKTFNRLYALIEALGKKEIPQPDLSEIVLAIKANTEEMKKALPCPVKETFQIVRNDKGLIDKVIKTTGEPK
jgi:hypothetical protein